MPTLSDAIDEYLDLRRRKKAKSTLVNEESILRRFLACVGNVNTRTLDQHHFEKFFYDGEDPLVDKLAPSSFNQARSRVTGFVTWLEGRRYTSRRALLDNVDHQKVVNRERMRLSATELLTLLDLADHPRDRATLAIAMNTAARANEITGIRVGDVRLDEGLIRLDISKTGKEDHRPITADLRHELERWFAYYRRDQDVFTLDDDWYLVPSKTHFNRRMSDGTFKHFGDSKLRPSRRMNDPHKIVQKVLAKAGRDSKFEGFHTIRRSVALLYFESLRDEGYDGALQATKALLNHEHASQTEQYLGLTNERRKRDLSMKDQPFLSAMVQHADIIPLKKGLADG